MLVTAVFLGGVGRHLEFDQAGKVQHPEYYQTYAKVGVPVPSRFPRAVISLVITSPGSESVD